AQPDNRRTLQGKRILVIEDEPLVAMDVESSLTAAGCEVVGPAATLERAKLLIEESDCDAALLDVNLAGQPVDELATLLTRKNRPFAFVTGYGRDALPSGFRGAVVLGKPFGADQLLATVEVLLYQPASVVQFRQKKLYLRPIRGGECASPAASALDASTPVVIAEPESQISSSVRYSRPWRASPSRRDHPARTVRTARRSSAAAERRASPVFPE